MPDNKGILKLNNKNEKKKLKWVRTIEEGDYVEVWCHRTRRVTEVVPFYNLPLWLSVPLLIIFDKLHLNHSCYLVIEKFLIHKLRIRIVVDYFLTIDGNFQIEALKDATKPGAHLGHYSDIEKRFYNDYLKYKYFDIPFNKE